MDAMILHNSLDYSNVTKSTIYKLYCFAKYFQALWTFLNNFEDFKDTSMPRLGSKFVSVCNKS